MTRDKEMKKLEKKVKEAIGSGYPSDPTTLTFLQNYYRKNKTMPTIARNSWDTVKTIIKNNNA